MPAAIVSSIAGRPSRVAGILISRLGRSTSACRRAASAIVRVGVVGQVRVDLERDPAVLAVALVPDRPQHVAGVADVVAREREEDLLRVGLGGRQLADLVVVGVALGDRALEDRGVGGHADDAVADEAGEVAVVDEACATGSRSRRSGLALRAASAGSWALLGSWGVPLI